MQELCKSFLCNLKKPLLVFFLFILINFTVLAKEYTQDYIDPITYSKGDLRWCRLYGICTLDTLIVYNISVIGEVFNVTMNLITWNITESFNVGGNLVAKNASLTCLTINDSKVCDWDEVNVSITDTTVNNTGYVNIETVNTSTACINNSCISDWSEVNVSGGGVPGGDDTELQFNDNGAFGGVTALTYDGTDLTLASTAQIKATSGAGEAGTPITINANANSRLGMRIDNNGYNSVCAEFRHASNDVVNIGGSTAMIDVRNSARNVGIWVRGSSNTKTALELDTGKLIVEDGEAIFNEDSGDHDFRIESNNEINMFVVDGGNDLIDISGGYGSTGVTIYDDGNISMDGSLGIGTTTPTSKLHVIGTMNVTENTTFGKDIIVNGTVFASGINITSSFFALTDNENSSLRFTLKNLNSDSGAASVITTENDVGGTMSIGVVSENYMIGDMSYPNATTLISRSKGDMAFVNSYDKAFSWLYNPSDDNDLNNLVEIMKVNEDGLNLSVGSIFLGDFETSAAGGSKVVKRSNANGALFGISNPIAGANPTSGAGYVTIQDCGNYTVDAHSSLDTNNPNGVVHHLRGCLVTEDWRLNPDNSSSSFEFEDGVNNPVLKINKSGVIVFKNFTIGSPSSITNITMFTNPSGNPACCGVMDDMSWGCSAGACS